MIAHIDMDAFFASIEQAINPRLAGKPLIVGSRNNRLHTVVCAASYQAKALGIDSGMNSAEAFKLCPQLEFVSADQSKYIWTSEQILEMLKELGFAANYASIDEFQLDIGNHSAPQELCSQIQKKIFAEFHITASIGVAKNWLLAKLASKLNKPNGIAILNDANLEKTLEKIPAKQLCGVGDKTSQVLENLGIKTCLELYHKSSQFLEAHLGQTGMNFYILLHCQDRFDSQENDSPAKSIGHSYTLPRASANTGFIQAWLRLLAEMVGKRLRQNDLSAKTVHLWLNGQLSGNFNHQKTYLEPTNDSYEIYQRCLKIMAKIGPNLPKIRALGITCSGLSQPAYLPLFNAEKRREDLIKTLDQINAKFGDNSIYPAVIDQTRIIG